MGVRVTEAEEVVGEQAQASRLSVEAYVCRRALGDHTPADCLAEHDLRRPDRSTAGIGECLFSAGITETLLFRPRLREFLEFSQLLQTFVSFVFGV